MCIAVAEAIARAGCPDRQSGEAYYLKRSRKNGLRLGFAFVPVQKMEDGVKLIAEEVKRLM